MKNNPPTIVETLKETLTGFLNSCGELADSNGNATVVHSQAAKERATFQCKESIVSGLAIANILLEGGADHLSLFAKSIDEPIESIACWTCIRSMMESCSIAKWLLAPQIDARIRIGWVFALRYQGLMQHQRFAQSIGQPNSEILRIRERIDSIEQNAINLGYSIVRDRNGRRIGIAERMPGATEMIRDQLGDESTYRLLSAVPHGHQWAVRKCSKTLSTGFLQTKVCDSGDPTRRNIYQSKIKNLKRLVER